jgi:hypothetical protein
MLSILFAVASFFVKLIFYVIFFRSEPQVDSAVNLRISRNEHFLLRNNGSHLSLFRGIFSERNSVANPRYSYLFSPASPLSPSLWFTLQQANGGIRA